MDLANPQLNTRSQSIQLTIDKFRPAVVSALQCVFGGHDGVTTMGNTRTITRLVVLTALWAVFAAVACGAEDGSGGEVPESSAEVSDPADTALAETTVTTLSPEAEVEAAVAAHDAMLLRLLQAPDPDDPEIAQRSTGTSRETAESGLAELAALGQHGIPGPNMSTTVLSADVTGDRATVEACEVDDGRLIDTATGDVLDDDVVTRLVTISLERVEGTWLVSNSVIEETWEGVTDCA